MGAAGTVEIRRDRGEPPASAGPDRGLTTVVPGAAAWRLHSELRLATTADTLALKETSVP
jgi:hypothetical protein